MCQHKELSMGMNDTHKKKLERYAQYMHLPADLQDISKPICDLMHEMATLCADSVDPAEVTRGLNALIEAKDCFVRAMLP